MHASIRAIEYHLPPHGITTDNLSATFPEWSVSKIDAKTGITTRHIAAADECASDLAVTAAEQLFDSGACDAKDIDFILFCTQSPDYVLPTTACLIQQRLNIPASAGALDYNLGCSGFVYGLGLAEGLIASQQASNVLLLTAETYSKYMKHDDKTSRTIFGDGAAATLITAVPATEPIIGPFVYGTDGRGGSNLIAINSGARRSAAPLCSDSHTGTNTGERGTLFMNGNAMFTFVLSVVPRCIDDLLSKAKLGLDDVDLVVFHQANAYILEELRLVLGIPRSKMQITISHCANTVSSTIPIALKHADQDRLIRNGSILLVVGFGVGYSWGATLVRWGNFYRSSYPISVDLAR